MNAVREYIASYDPEIMLLDPPHQFDKCVVGIARRCGMEDCAVYDAEMVIAALEEEGMSHEDAVEWYDFNIEGAYLGPKTPLFLSRLPREVIDSVK